jgi:hypothetical protein
MLSIGALELGFDIELGVLIPTWTTYVYWNINNKCESCTI